MVNKDNYIDLYGRMHDKMCRDGNYSSNNGWIYSAIYLKLGGSLNIDMDYAMKCAIRRVRHLDKTEPPISRDEILGLAYLGVLYPSDVKGWNFSPYPLPKLDLHLLIDQLHECVDQHRNFFWQNKLEQVYHLAFMVPLQDRNFINKSKPFNRKQLLYLIIEKIDKFFIKPSSKSSYLIRFLKYDIMPPIEIFESYFGIDHPITVLARKKIKNV